MPDQQLVAISASHRDPVPGARRVADIPPETPIRFSIVVRRKPGGEDNALRLAEDASESMSERRSRLAQEAGADQNDLERVTQYVTGAGMTVESADVASRTVTVHGTAAQAEAAFGVSLGRYETDDLDYRGREGSVQVPADLADVIQAVLGLDNRPQAHVQLKRRQPLNEDDLPAPGPANPTEMLPTITAEAAATPGPRPQAQPMWPTQVASLYTFPSNLDGSGQTIAIIELGGGFRQQELTTYFDRAGIPAPSVEAIGVHGGQNSPGTDADGEVLLDIEVSGSVAPGADIAVYFGDPSDAGFLGALSAAVHDSQRSPSVISISWGAPEDSWTEQARQAFDDVLIDAAALDVTVYAAAGDHGAGDATKDAQAHTDFPASSPYMIGCGGTTLFNESGHAGEVVWNDGDGWATGGGISVVYPPPPWQNVTLPPNVNGDGQPGRGVPDVAGNADNASGYIVLFDGHWEPVGGTSAVAPLYAGLTALLNQALGHPVHGLLQTLYAIAADQQETVFHDVTVGDNSVPNSEFGPAVQGYQAATGWDACTGLGSIDGTALLQHLQSMAAPAEAQPPTAATPVP
jgi:kumamolisin